MTAREGSGTFLQQTAQIKCDLLFRVRPNRKLYRAPPPYGGLGRPAIHGSVFRLGDSTTWGPPDAECRGTDPELGAVHVQRWEALHFPDAPQRLVTLFRIERPAARGTRRDPRVVWLGWCGQALTRESVEQAWRAYLRR